MTLNELRDGLRKSTPDQVITLAANLNQEYDYELRLSADPEDIVDQIEKEVDVEDLLEAYETVILKIEVVEDPEEGSDDVSDGDGEDGEGDE